MVENTYRSTENNTKPSKTSFLKAVRKDKRIWLVLGFTLQSIALFLCVAFISYFLHGRQDQVNIEKFLKEKGSLFKIQVHNWFGILGALSAHLFVFRWFGITAFLVILFMFLAGHKLIYKKIHLSLFRNFNFTTFSIFWVNTAVGYIANHMAHHSIFEYIVSGLGVKLAAFCHTIFGRGTILLLIATLIIFVVVFFNVTSLKLKGKLSIQPIMHFYSKLKKFFFFKKSKVNIPREIIKPDEQTPTQIFQSFPLNKTDTISENSNDIKFQTFSVEKKETQANFVDTVENLEPKIDTIEYIYPPVSLLKDYSQAQVQVSKKELEQNKDTIVSTLINFKIGIESIKATIGPTVTLYEIIPEPGVKISRIKNLEDDIALSLAALGIRIIAPIPGKGTIGIEVPNKEREVVSLRKLLATDTFMKSNMDLPIVLGKTISNEICIQDLTKMPHLLIAGATGQGKSVGLNVILTSLIYKKHPSQLKLVLVDPKKVELSLYNKLEDHFLAKLPNTEEPIITENKKVVNTLNSLCIEMDTRYELLKEAGTRNIKEYNEKFIHNKLDPEKGHQFLPYIVLVIDEFADMMMTAGKEVEMPIARLAQLARAIGIHLVLATQRPSVNVITGIIKANFPVRISFRVTSKIDSRTILDTGGAEQLVGQGDMLLSMNSDIARLQCPFLDTQEVEDVCAFIHQQKGCAHEYMLPFYISENEENNKNLLLEDRDPLFEEAAHLIVTHQQGSTSLIQRKMKLGYNRSGRLIDQLEAAGIVGPFEGSKAREVLIKDPETLQDILRDL